MKDEPSALCLDALTQAVVRALAALGARVAEVGPLRAFAEESPIEAAVVAFAALYNQVPGMEGVYAEQHGEVLIRAFGAAREEGQPPKEGWPDLEAWSLWFAGIPERRARYGRPDRDADDLPPEVYDLAPALCVRCESRTAGILREILADNARHAEIAEARYQSVAQTSDNEDMRTALALASVASDEVHQVLRNALLAFIVSGEDPVAWIEGAPPGPLASVCQERIDHAVWLIKEDLIKAGLRAEAASTEAAHG